MRNIPLWVAMAVELLSSNDIEDTEDPPTEDTFVDPIHVSPDDQTEKFSTEDSIAWLT